MIGVLIADGHALFGAALAALLQSEPDVEVVGRAHDQTELLELARAARPDVAIIDSRLPGPNAADGLTAAKSVHVTLPRVAVLVLTAQGTGRELQRAAACGVRGYLRKHSSPGTLIDGIRSVAAGQQSFDPQVVAEVLSGHSTISTLTAREMSTLRLVASGMSNSEIAGAMRLAPGTVRNYVSAVLAKTHARNRVDAVRIAHELALI